MDMTANMVYWGGGRTEGRKGRKEGNERKGKEGRGREGRKDGRTDGRKNGREGRKEKKEGKEEKRREGRKGRKEKKEGREKGRKDGRTSWGGGNLGIPLIIPHARHRRCALLFRFTLEEKIRSTSKKSKKTILFSPY